jgi:hypothetical protein
VKNNNILYIGGYGRSGSTVLEKILTTHPEITGGGEIFRMAEVFSDEMATCTCGEKLKNCPVWGSVRIEAVKEAVQYGGLTGLQAVMMQIEGRSNKKYAHDAEKLGTWLRLNKAAFKALRSANPDARWIVDSSKTARGAVRRPLRLIGNGADMKFIGVRRMAGSVLHSVSKGTNRAIEDGQAARSDMVSKARRLLYAYAGWAMASVAADDIMQELGTKALGLRFEDLSNDPEGQIGVIANWLGVPFPTDWEARMINTPRHMIGGNRNRYRQERVHRTPLPLGKDIIGDIGLGVARQLTKLGAL